MSAEEARNLSFMSNSAKNDFTDLKFVYDRIKKSAQDKATHCVFFGEIPNEMREILERDGFVIRVFGKNEPQPITEISW